MRGWPAEQVRTEHRGDHRSVPAARLPGDAAMLPRRPGPIAAVDPGNDLLAEVGVIATGARRVDELGPAVRGPAVDVDEDARRGLAAGEELVGELGEVEPEGGAVAPHVELPGHSLDLVDRRIAPIGVVVVARRQVDPDGSPKGVTERVVLEHVALDPALLDAARPLDGPGARHPSRLRSRARASARPRPPASRPGRRGLPSAPAHPRRRRRWRARCDGPRPRIRGAAASAPPTRPPRSGWPARSPRCPGRNRGPARTWRGPFRRG